MGIRYGFNLGVNPGTPVSPNRNCVTAYEQPMGIDNYLAEEIKFGSIVGPFNEAPLTPLQLNRFGVIPKSTPGKFRLITDLSFPRDASFNDLISDSEAEVSYACITEAISLVMKLGHSALLAKFDLRRAYRLLPVRLEDRWLLGMRWKGQFYLDLAIPFCLRSAPQIFKRFADALQSIFEQIGGVENIQHYLDDFLVAGPPQSSVCESDLYKCLSLAKNLGVPIAPEKTEGPSTSITYLGFILDSEKQELRLPVEKLTKVHLVLDTWKDRKTGTKRDLLSLIGLLQHCCQAVVLGRPFLRRLIDRAKTVSELHHFVTLSLWEKEDIQWWYTIFKSWNGKSLFHLPKWENAPDVSITSDAAGSIGFAAIHKLEWFAGKWPTGTGSLNIAIKELVPIVLAASIWGHEWERKRILFRCDNAAVVVLLRQGSCRDRHLAFLVRELSMIAFHKSLTFTSVHIPGPRNVKADALSRFNFQAFHSSAAPDAALNLLPIPEAFLQKLLFPPWITSGKHC
eukprot:Seg1363.36 transcript_id=Seg1363.36/GoldUCD/mRNA.D3Y31 product="Polyprotein P3" protein_id=Seg1363.36/GoldUCD/D3Y31